MSTKDPLATATEERRAKEKLQFLEALRAKFGNATEAAKAVNLHRGTPYTWRKDDPVFAAEWDEINESLKDYAESKLMINIGRGKEASIFFFLKCRAKDRGYIERSDINITGKLSLEDVLAESWKAGTGKKPDGAA